jgi:hypothetical protein
MHLTGGADSPCAAQNQSSLTRAANRPLEKRLHQVVTEDTNHRWNRQMAIARSPNKQKPSLTYGQLTAPVGDIVYSFEPKTFGSRRLPVGELTFTAIPLHPFNAEGFARDLDHYGSGVSVIADSDIYLAETDQRVWDALLRNKQLRMISPVAIEIEHWLNDPRGINESMHKVVKDAHDLKSNAITKFELPAENPSLVYAAEWYINLLGMCRGIRWVIR